MSLILNCIWLSHVQNWNWLWWVTTHSCLEFLTVHIIILLSSLLDQSRDRARKTYFILHKELWDNLMIQTVLCRTLLLSLSEFTSLTVEVIVDVFYIRQRVRKREVYEFVLHVQIEFHLTLFHQLLFIIT